MKHPTRRQNFANRVGAICAHYLTLRLMIIVVITIMIMTNVGGNAAYLSIPARRKATRRRMYGKYCVNLNALRRRAKISAYNN